MKKLTPINQNIKKEIPVAPAVTVRPKTDFKFSEPLVANPATDAARFEAACREADAGAKKHKRDTIVFKASTGFYFTEWMSTARVDIKMGLITVLYEAKAPEVKANPKTYNSTALGRVTIPED